MRRDIGIGLMLVLAVAGVYAPVARFGFINYDDPDYVSDNSHVRQGLTLDNVGWAFTTLAEANWHPLTWLSHMLDYQVFGAWAGGHHLVNVALHAANSLLLFLILKRMTGARWPSAAVAGLFALHPLHVESVAWVAERKDVLSTLFWMLALGAYALYAERPSLVRYAAVFVLLALGLSAKPMLVTLPFVFLLLDFWPLGRLQLPPADGAPADGPWRAAAARALRLALEKVPLLALSAASSVVTYLVQARGGSIASTEEHPLIARLSGVPIAYAAYLAKAVWPSDLAVFYPFVNRPWWQPVAAAGGLAALTALVIMSVRRRPYLAVGWFWFLGMLVPVIGLVQVGAQAMADRYTYVPLVGVFIMAAWGVADTAKAWCHRRKVLVPLGVATVAVCGVLAARQVSFWSDNETLWRRAAEATTHNGLAHNNLGAALQRRGLKEEALHHYREAVRLKPDYIDARNNLGGVLFNQDRFEEAAVHFAEAIRLDPSQARGYANLGAVLCRLGRNREALDVLRRAAALDPDLVDAHCNLAVALLTEGLTQEAMAHASQAARLNPALAAPQHNWGGALFVEGRLDEAAVHFREALRLQPDYVEAHAYPAACLLARGASAEAAAHVREALRLKPDFAFARQLEAQIRSGVAPSPLTPLPAPSAGSTPAGGP